MRIPAAPVFALLACACLSGGTTDTAADGDTSGGEDTADDTGGDTADDTGSDCPDADGDGHPDNACGGDDCDDADDTVFPGAADEGFTLGDVTYTRVPGVELHPAANDTAHLVATSSGWALLWEDSLGETGTQVCTGDGTSWDCDVVTPSYGYRITSVAVSGSSTLGIDTVVFAANSGTHTWIFAGSGADWGSLDLGNAYGDAAVATDPGTGEVWVANGSTSAKLSRVTRSGPDVALADSRVVGTLDPNSVTYTLSISAAGPTVAVGLPYDGDVVVFPPDGGEVEVALGSINKLSLLSNDAGESFVHGIDDTDVWRKVSGGASARYGKTSSFYSTTGAILGDGLVLGDFNKLLHADPDGDGTFTEVALTEMPFTSMQVVGDEVVFLALPDFDDHQPLDLARAPFTLPDGVDQDCDGDDG